mmetsp:Transcript_2379/g.4942  ORF Transcript_2379/g.4942 Transcript_2379/m.4942 type:complete len:294 (-) Transcript_2379:600-1481(-)
MLHVTHTPLAVAFVKEALRVARRAAVVHLQHRVPTVGEPLRCGVEPPEVPRPRSAVHQQHERTWRDRVRARQVAYELESVSRGDRHRLHVREVVAEQRGRGDEERGDDACRTRVDGVLRRSVVTSVRDDPRLLVTCAAHDGDLRTRRSLRLKLLELGLELFVEEGALDTRIVEAHRLHLLSVLVDRDASHIALRARRDLLNHISTREIEADERSGLASKRREHQRALAVLGKVDQVAFLAVREGDELAPRALCRIAHTDRLARVGLVDRECLAHLKRFILSTPPHDVARILRV